MEARRLGAIVFAVLAAGGVGASQSTAADFRTPNFVINAPTPELAQEMGREAERLRKALALEWLGREMPNWFQPCPVQIQVGDHLGAGGETSFVFDRGEVFGWKMSIQGSRERLLDSVLPHEITHTVFASHFRQALPRWADEGACTTVEHPSEQRRHQQMLVQFLQTNRGLAFNRMFAMMDYPRDIMPLYAQGHSVSRYLIEQGGKRKYVNFVSEGLKTRDWPGAVRNHGGARPERVANDLARVGEGREPAAEARGGARNATGVGGWPASAAPVGADLSRPIGRYAHPGAAGGARASARRNRRTRLLAAARLGPAPPRGQPGGRQTRGCPREGRRTQGSAGRPA
ncbi:MAG: hypothetical protein U0836_10130 [Pirellulales bacterium]